MDNFVLTLFNQSNASNFIRAVMDDLFNLTIKQNTKEEEKHRNREIQNKRRPNRTKMSMLIIKFIFFSSPLRI